MRERVPLSPVVEQGVVESSAQGARRHDSVPVGEALGSPDPYQTPPPLVVGPPPSVSRVRPVPA